jgi:hypothetical protein
MGVVTARRARSGDGDREVSWESSSYLGGRLTMLDLCRDKRVVAGYFAVGLGGHECPGRVATLALACIGA